GLTPVQRAAVLAAPGAGAHRDELVGERQRASVPLRAGALQRPGQVHADALELDRRAGQRQLGPPAQPAAHTRALVVQARDLGQAALGPPAAERGRTGRPDRLRRVAVEVLAPLVVDDVVVRAQIGADHRAHGLWAVAERLAGQH